MSMAEPVRPHDMAKKPINEAVTTAFDIADASHVIPAELIQKITENVIKQLQSSRLDGTSPMQSQGGFVPPDQPPHVPTSNPPTQAPALSYSQSVPRSPATTTSSASPGMPSRSFTPPSPQKFAESADPSSSPPLRPQNAPAHPTEISGSQSPTKKNIRAQDNYRSPSVMSHHSDASDQSRAGRPRGPARLSTGSEETTLERIWGQLFEEESCRPTPRWSSFLRGLATHLIDECEPKRSLVLTPTKMADFYASMKINKEFYPWSAIFDDERSSISRMYRELSCQHHLVQEKPDLRPDVPGLTPAGFERWMTLLLLADPDVECERLQQAVLRIPINNPDDKGERFPKEISRRLLPKIADLKLREQVEEAMLEHCPIELPQRTIEPTLTKADTKRDESPRSNATDPASSAPVHRPSVTFVEPELTASKNSIERERAPYSNVPETAIIDDTKPHDVPNSKPIERERKPYSTQPGVVKQYEPEDMRPSRDIRPARSRGETLFAGSAAAQTATLATALPNSRIRAESSAARTRPVNIPSSQSSSLSASGYSGSFTGNIKPDTYHNQHHQQPPSYSTNGAHHSGTSSSYYHHHPPVNSTSNPTSNRRHRSPSFSRGNTSDFRRDHPELQAHRHSYTPYNVTNNSSSATSTSTFDVGSAPSVPAFDESDTKRYFEERARQRNLRRAPGGGVNGPDDHRYSESPRRDREREYERDRVRDRDRIYDEGRRREGHKDDDAYYRAGVLGRDRERLHDDAYR